MRDLRLTALTMALSIAACFGCNDNSAGDGLGSAEYSLMPTDVHRTKAECEAALEADYEDGYDAQSSATRSCLTTNNANPADVVAVCENTPTLHEYDDVTEIGTQDIKGECNWECHLKVPSEGYIEYGMGCLNRFLKESQIAGGC